MSTQSDKSVRNQIFFQGKKFYVIYRCKNGIKNTFRIYSVDSAVQFPTELILRLIVFKETVRQRGS